MTWTVEASGTQTATIGTEHTLHTSAAAKTLVLRVDAVNMADGDRVELRIYSKVLSGSTLAVAYLATFMHVQAQPVKISLPIVAAGHASGTQFTLKQTAGTGRAFAWSVESV